ncbi:hypothetical protein pb186bvf_016939 [Paramecium bursaria]
MSQNNNLHNQILNNIQIKQLLQISIIQFLFFMQRDYHLQGWSAKNAFFTLQPLKYLKFNENKCYEIQIENFHIIFLIIMIVVLSIFLYIELFIMFKANYYKKSINLSEK